jgi:hypothetical protein
MSETEYYTRLCVRFGWTDTEQDSRRKRAAAMQEWLLLSVEARSVESTAEVTSEEGRQAAGSVACGKTEWLPREERVAVDASVRWMQA